MSRSIQSGEQIQRSRKHEKYRKRDRRLLQCKSGWPGPRAARRTRAASRGMAQQPRKADAFCKSSGIDDIYT